MQTSADQENNKVSSAPQCLTHTMVSRLHEYDLPSFALMFVYDSTFKALKVVPENMMDAAANEAVSIKLMY